MNPKRYELIVLLKILKKGLNIECMVQKRVDRLSKLIQMKIRSIQTIYKKQTLYNYVCVIIVIAIVKPGLPFRHIEQHIVYEF